MRTTDDCFSVVAVVCVCDPTSVSEASGNTPIIRLPNKTERVRVGVFVVQPSQVCMGRRNMCDTFKGGNIYCFFTMRLII